MTVLNQLLYYCKQLAQIWQTLSGQSIDIFQGKINSFSDLPWGVDGGRAKMQKLQSTCSQAATNPLASCNQPARKLQPTCSQFDKLLNPHS